jgi:hypothetical protein
MNKLKISIKYNKFLPNQKVALLVILTLVIINAVWIIICKSLGPVIALISYAFIAFLFLRKNDFIAGVIIGIVGFIIHFYELIFQGIIELKGFEIAFFFINLVFPIPLIYFSYKAYKEFKHNRQNA